MSMPRVLIVDESRTARERLALSLTRRGFDVTHCATGKQATELLHAEGADVVALEAVLPDGDGIDFCRSWKRDPDLAGIPVVVLTSRRCEVEDQVAGLNAGASAYLTEPVDPKILVAQLRMLVSSSAAQRRENAQEACFRECFGDLPIGLILVPGSSDQMTLNSYTERLLGVSTDEVRRQGLGGLFHPDHRDVVLKQVERLRTGQATSWQASTVLMSQSGQELAADLAAKVVAAGDDGRDVVILVQDVTAFRQARATIELERQLRDSEERFRRTFEQVAVGMAHVSVDGAFLMANGRLCDVLGYGDEELLRLSLQDVLHPEDCPRDPAQLGKLLGVDRESNNIELRGITKHGAEVWISLTTAPVCDAEGAVKYVIVVLEDISKRKQALDDLEESERSLRILYEAVPVGIAVTTQAGEVLKFNETLVEMLGLTQEESLQINSQALYCDESQREELIKRVRREGEVRNYETRFRRKDGSTLEVSMNVTSISIRGRAALLTSIQDVSHRGLHQELPEHPPASEEVAESVSGVDPLPI
jgi:PAS domain S-box-containing protein